MKIFPPLYLIGKKGSCWKCGHSMSIVSLLAPNIEEADNQVSILFGISYLPEEIVSYIQKRVPTYKLKYSKTTGSECYSNTCPSCKILYGDFFLNSEPGDIFFPIEEETAMSIYKTKIPFNKPFSIDALPSIGSGELILKFAKEIL